MKTQNESPKKNFKINRGLYFIDIDKFNDKSPSDLWEKNQRRKFFIWIYMLLASMIFVLLLNIVKWIFFFVDKSQIINHLQASSPTTNMQQIEASWTTTLVYEAFQIVIPAIVVWSLISSIKKCFEQKNFKSISFLSTLFVFIQMFYGFGYWFNLIIYKTNIAVLFGVSWIYAVTFSLSIIYPLIWFFISRNVSLIRLISIRLEARENLMNQMNSANNQNGNFNPFGSSTFFGANGQPNPENGASGQNDSYKKNDEFYQRLKNLSRDQLEEIAKKLSISGYDSMSDEEIIEIIYDIRSVQDKNKKEIEVETSKVDKSTIEEHEKK